MHPERFDPTRFLPGAPPPVRFACLAFGVGPKRVTPVAVMTTVPDRAPVFRLVRR